MLKSGLLAGMGQEGLVPLAKDHDGLVAHGLASFQLAREFQQLFPTAEHRIVQAEHDFGPRNDWRLVHDWLCRAQLYDRYVALLSAAIDIANDGTIATLKPPELHVFEVVEVTKGKDEEGGPKYTLRFGSFDADDWRTLVESSGDLSSLVGELIADQPVSRFEIYWRDTQPGWIAGRNPG